MNARQEQHPGAASGSPHDGNGSPPKPRGKRGATAVLALLAAASLGAAGLLAPNGPVPAAGSVLWPEQRVGEPVDAGLSPASEAIASDAVDDLSADLDSALDDSALDGDLAAVVLDVSGETIYDRDGSETMVPASSQKVLTCAAVLQARGPGYRIPTRLLRGESGTLVLAPEGDVTLSIDGDGYYSGAASLQDLADQALEALDGEPVETLLVDGSVFEGPEAGERVDLGENYTAPMRPLMTDGGRVEPKDPNSAAPRFSDPLQAAAEELADMLGATAKMEDGAAAEDLPEVAAVYSAPLQRLVEYALLTSDNVLTDALSRQAALGRGLPGSFESGADAVIATLRELDVAPEGVALVDGSGLSHANRATAASLAGILAAAVDVPDLEALYSGLPVAGYSGSLQNRFEDADSESLGLVRAKTGTLNGVSSLSGFATDPEGRVLYFSFVVNDRGDQLAAQRALDAAAAALIR